MISENPQLELALLIHDISVLSDRVYDTLLKPAAKITRPQLWILLHLAKTAQEGMMQVELARYLGVNPIGLGKMLDRMEKIKIIVRVVDKKDRRSNRVLLTAKGRAALGRIEKIGVMQQGLPVQGIPPENLAVLIDLLRMLKSSAAALHESTLAATPPRKPGRKPAR